MLNLYLAERIYQYREQELERKFSLLRLLWNRQPEQVPAAPASVQRMVAEPACCSAAA